LSLLLPLDLQGEQSLQDAASARDWRPGCQDVPSVGSRTYVAAEDRQPDHIVPLKELNEPAIKDWWQGFGLTRDGTQRGTR
jgi:hypothetical protein